MLRKRPKVSELTFSRRNDDGRQGRLVVEEGRDDTQLEEEVVCDEGSQHRLLSGVCRFDLEHHLK